MLETDTKEGNGTGFKAQIKALCGTAGLDETQALAQYQEFREAGAGPAGAFGQWYAANKRLLSTVSGDYKAVVLSIGKMGRKVWPKGYTMKEGDRKLDKVKERISDPNVKWTHELYLALQYGDGTVLCQADIWDDPTNDENNPLVPVLDKLESGQVLDLFGWSLNPKANPVKLSPKKGATGKALDDKKVADSIFNALESIDIATARDHSSFGSTMVYDAVINGVSVYTNPESKKQTVFFALTTARDMPVDISASDIEGFMGLVELPYYPDEAETVDEDQLKASYLGNTLKVCAKVWPEKENKVETGNLKGRINYL